MVRGIHGQGQEGVREQEELGWGETWKEWKRHLKQYQEGTGEREVDNIQQEKKQDMRAQEGTLEWEDELEAMRDQILMQNIPGSAESEVQDMREDT